MSEILGDLLYPSVTCCKPLLSVLVEEFFCCQDLDDNGLIYGYDFYINGDDVPSSLKDLTNTEYWSTPRLYISSWADFKENKFDNLKEIAA